MHQDVVGDREGFEKSRKLIVYVEEESKEERSSEDSISDMGIDKEGPPKDEDNKESACKRDIEESSDHSGIREMVAAMEIIDDSDKYDDPFQSVFSNLK